VKFKKKFSPETKIVNGRWLEKTAEVLKAFKVPSRPGRL
jgi:hypothetical protein